jgi:hypothetical protein
LFEIAPSLPQPPILMARVAVHPNIAGEFAGREGAVASRQNLEHSIIAFGDMVV